MRTQLATRVRRRGRLRAVGALVAFLALALAVVMHPAVQAQGPTPSPALLPTVAAQAPTPDQRFAIVSSGNFHTCALRANGEAVCWGAGPHKAEGEYGPVDLGQASPPDGERFVAISSGGFHTCGLRDDGTAACWGGRPRRPNPGSGPGGIRPDIAAGR